ncbi:SSI family serine proteinase inhibitor [Nocardia cyriacigeorgica]|uniref:SSI family serine proteinase inhibitor n=1 Tax=Nocardia cyriacigeorgica TaxID=135487 RepID=UPI003CC7DB5E
MSCTSNPDGPHPSAEGACDELRPVDGNFDVVVKPKSGSHVPRNGSDRGYCPGCLAG